LVSQQRFEGPVLEDLLDRVRAEAGPGAQIVAANRVRKGGLGGFFAREFFEVVVDIPETLDIAQHEQDEAPANKIVAALSQPEPQPLPVPAGIDGPRRVPASILDLAEAVNDTERHIRDTRERARAHIDLVDDQPIVDDRTDDTDGFDDDDLDEIEVRRADEPPRGGDGGPNAAGERFASILDRLSNETSAPPRTARQRRPEPMASEVRERLEQQAEGARRTATAARVTADPVTIDGDQTLTITPTALGAAIDPVKKVSFRRVPRSEAVLERPENALARLGLPARLVPRGVSPKELRGALTESLADLPAVPAVPEANGVVIAVVGTGASAVLLARELCGELGLDPERIVLATQEPLGEGIPAWLQVCDGATAEERRRSWRRRDLPTLVAVSLPAGRDALPWAREILDQLEPTIAWSIVNAGWKPEDVRDWIERLGGVDAIALAHLDQTVSPAAILDLGIPIGRLDGRPATPIAWAELLLSRMQR
jgi:hypothetical protein